LVGADRAKEVAKATRFVEAGLAAAKETRLVAAGLAAAAAVAAGGKKPACCRR
jgi:hypothetical protein